MKVLYLEHFYPHLSESYVATEIDWMLRHGVEIRVWSSATSRVPYLPQTQVYRRSLGEAITDFRPDFIHCHTLTMANAVSIEMEKHKIPMTVRSHSVDFYPDLIGRLLELTWIAKIWTFPHFLAELRPSPKLGALTACFNPDLFYPAQKEKRRVIRVGAGLSYKALDDVLAVAELCPKFEFLIIFGGCATHMGWGEKEKYFQEEFCRDVSSAKNVDMILDAPHGVAANAVRSSGILLHTNNPSAHRFGQPVSICEAMATGSYILCRNNPGVTSYIGPGSDVYNSVNDAADLINGTLDWGPVAWEETIKAAIRNSERYASDVVLPTIIGEWSKVRR